MGLDNVIDEIISQAKRSREEIISTAKLQAKKIVDEVIEKADDYSKNSRGKTQGLIDESKRMEISSLNIHLHKTILETKRDIIDEIYNRFKEKLNNLEASERKKILQKLLEKAEKELPEAKFFYCNNKDRGLLSNIKDLQFKSIIDCSGGLILETGDGRVRVNYTFEQLFENLKESYLNEVAKRVF